MEITEREHIAKEVLPGRALQRAIGENSKFSSGCMTVGYATYDASSGIMEPHHHAEETVVIFDVKDGYVGWGPEQGHMTQRVKLKKGMILHIPENEWHVFTYEPGGFVDIIFIYGTSQNIRPEDNPGSKESR